MTTTNLWRFVQHDSPYYDYEKELYSLPDEGNTSVDMRLTFDADYNTCYYTLMLRNDDGNTRDCPAPRPLSQPCAATWHPSWAMTWTCRRN
jgi:hypothetical protein